MADLSQLSDEQLGVYREMLAKQQAGGSTPAAPNVPVGERPLGSGPHAVVDLVRSMPGALMDLGKGAVKGAFNLPGIRTPKALSAPPANTAESMGQFLPLAGGLLAGGATAAEMLPSAERAGLNFNRAMALAKNVPVDVNKFAAPVLRARQLNAVAGDPMAPVLRKALTRIGPTTEPLTYGDARIMASSAGRKAAQESLAPQRLTGEMGRRLSETARGLDEATQDAATRAGVGDVHANAMREYRQAKRIENATSVAKKYALRTLGGAAGAGALYEGYRALK